MADTLQADRKIIFTKGNEGNEEPLVIVETSRHERFNVNISHGISEEAVQAMLEEMRTIRPQGETGPASEVQVSPDAVRSKV